jgi:hypothetical protein
VVIVGRELNSNGSFACSYEFVFDCGKMEYPGHLPAYLDFFLIDHESGMRNYHPAFSFRDQVGQW